MHTAILLATLVRVFPSVNVQDQVCRSIQGMRSVNLPANSTAVETDVENAAVVYYEGRYAGEIFVTQGRTLWFTGGTKSAGITADAADLKAASDALGLQFVGPYSFHSVEYGSLLSLLSAPFALIGCY